MENIVLQKRWVQGGNVVVDDLRGTMITGEAGAHTFQISGVDSAHETVAITGTITGRFLTATNVTVPLTGSVSDGVASLTLTEDCYVIPGRFVLSVFATNGSTTQCIYCAVGNVFRTQSDIIEYPSASIPDIEQIIADAQEAVTEINAEVTAAQAAVAAAQTAVDGIEAQRQTMIEAIASVAGQGTDTTLSQSGVAADAKAAGDQISDLKSAISDIGAMSFPINKFLGTWDVDGYIADASFIPASGYKTTKPIPLKAGNYLYSIYYNSYGVSALNVWLCDEEGAYVSRITGTRTGTLDYGGRKEIIAFTLPSDSFVRTNVGLISDDIVSYMLVEGSTAADFPDHYIPHEDAAFKLNDNIKLSEVMGEEVERIVNNTISLSGKIAADGDSICYGNGYRGGYAKIISDFYSLPYQNIAVGGGTIAANTYQSDQTTPRHWICRSIENIDSDADYIIIEGGINDASLSVPLGSITAGFTAALDDTTFYGAMESICKTLCTKFIGKKYAFLLPHGILHELWNGDYYNAVVNCCAKWGIPLIDITKYAPPFNQFRGSEDYDTIRTTYTTDGDGWHPTEICYRRYYVPKIVGVLSQL